MACPFKQGHESKSHATNVYSFKNQNVIVKVSDIKKWKNIYYPYLFYGLIK